MTMRDDLTIRSCGRRGGALARAFEYFGQNEAAGARERRAVRSGLMGWFERVTPAAGLVVVVAKVAVSIFGKTKLGCGA